jgi:hypothetical protein
LPHDGKSGILIANAADRRDAIENRRTRKPLPLVRGLCENFYSDDARFSQKCWKKRNTALSSPASAATWPPALGSTPAETRLAEAIGLCHDVGRFRQVTVYRTFRDHDSVDHGRLGVEELLAAGIDAAWSHRTGRRSPSPSAGTMPPPCPPSRTPASPFTAN